MAKNNSTNSPDAESSSTQSIKRHQPPVYEWAKLVRAVEKQGGIPTDEQIAAARRTLVAFEDWSKQMRSK